MKKKKDTEEPVADVQPAVDNKPQTVANETADDDAASLEEVLSRFDGRHNYKPEKTAFLSIAGLLIGIFGWIMIFFLPKRVEHDFTPIYQQIYLLGEVAIVGLLLAIFGRKRGPGISFFAYLIAGGLLLFALIAYIVLNVISG